MDIFDLHYPESGASKEKNEKSAYYWWYRYMQLVDGYGRKHPLWKDFGDVRKPFWDWWCDHGEDIFMTGAKSGVEEATTDEEIAQARAEGAYIVRVDSNCSREYLERTFRAFLDEKKFSKRPGRKKATEETEFEPARRPFEKTPDHRSLANSFKVLEKWLEKERNNEKMTLYEIGAAVGVNPSAIIQKGDPPSTQRDKKNSMNATVSRYLKWGKSILAGVSIGKFPVM